MRLATKYESKLYSLLVLPRLRAARACPVLLDPLTDAVEVKAVPALAVADLAICLVVQLAFHARVFQILLARATHSVVLRDFVSVDPLFLCNCNLHYEMTLIVRTIT